jgi:hypothetical protein
MGDIDFGTHQGVSMLVAVLEGDKAELLERAVKAEKKLFEAEILLQRWLIFKNLLTRAGDGKGGFTYMGPVADTEAYFGRQRPDDYDVYDPSKLRGI